MSHQRRRTNKIINQRRFCRIDDEIILQYEESPQNGGLQSRQPSKNQGKIAFLACSRLAEYRRQMRNLYRQVRDESRAISSLLSLLDKKIDLVADVLLLEDIDSISASWRSKVQLSACGLVFRTHEEYRSNTVLLLRFILLPSFAGIVTEGRVVRSTRYLRAVDGCRFSTAVEFLNMKESTRDLIAKHVFDHQTARLRRDNESDA